MRSFRMDPNLKMLLLEYGYNFLTVVPGQGLCGLQRFAFTWGLVVGLTEDGYRGRYCYETEEQATRALANWKGDGDPSGPWIKYKGEGGERLGPGAVEEFYEFNVPKADVDSSTAEASQRDGVERSE